MNITYEEAINILNEASGVCATDNIFIASHMAIEALEKQIPKKPNVIKGEEEYDYACPTCGKLCFFDYCFKCGQAIDWED